MIDGNESGSVVTFENGEDSTAVLSGFTITNGYAQGAWQYNNGGGIYCCDASPTLVNVTVSGNKAEYGSAIFCAYSNPVLVNAVMWNDSPQEIYFTGWGQSNSIRISHSDIQGGSQGIVTNDNGTIFWMDGNIEVDPLFVDPDNGDFQLQKGSPCIDAGTAFFVWEGDTLVNLPDTAYQGNAPDMGTYESPYTAGIGEDHPIRIQFALHQPNPNPFNPTTTIEFSLPTSGVVTLTVYDILGRVIETLLNQNRDTGNHTIQWNAHNLPSGIYFVRMVTDNFTQTREVMVLR